VTGVQAAGRRHLMRDRLLHGVGTGVVARLSGVGGHAIRHGDGINADYARKGLGVLRPLTMCIAAREAQ